MSEAITPARPERRDGFPDGCVLGIAFPVHVSRVRELALGGRGGAVDFGVGEGFEVREGEAVGEGVDAGVDEEAEAEVVGGGEAGVFFEGGVARGRGFFGEVFGRVEVFDYGAHGVGVGVCEGDSAGLDGGGISMEELDV